MGNLWIDDSMIDQAPKAEEPTEVTFEEFESNPSAKATPDVKPSLVL